MNTKYINAVNTVVFIVGLFALISFISVCLTLPASALSMTVTDVKETAEIAKSSDQDQAVNKNTAKKAELEAKAEVKAKREAKRKAEKEAKLKAKAEAKAKRKAEKEAKLKAKAEAKAKKKAEAKARFELKKKAEAEEVAKIAAEKKARKEAIAKYKAKKKIAKEARLKSIAVAKALSEAESRLSAERKQQEYEKNNVKAADEKISEAKAKIKKLNDIIAKSEEEKAIAEAKIKSVGERLAMLEANLATRKKDEQAQLSEEQKAVTEAHKAVVPMLPRGKWRVSAGVTYRTIHSQKMTTRSYSENYPISSKSENATTHNTAAGDLNAISDRIYTDGYVGHDQWTDLDGGTWNWGYNNSSQIQGDTLSLRWVGQSVTEFARTTSLTPGEVGKDSDSTAGVFLQAERDLIKTGWIDYGLHLDFSWLSFASGGNLMTFRDVQAWDTYNAYMVDNYSVAGLGITPASTPYQGNYADSGPTINNIPETRTSAGNAKTASHSYEAYNQINETLDMDLSTLSLGLTMSGNYRLLYLAGVVGPTLNWTETSASYQETLYQKIDGGTPSVLTEWNNYQNDTEFTVGYFVMGQIGIRVIGGLELGFFGRYDWLENVTGEVGQSCYSVNPEGSSFGGTVNYAF